MLTQRTFWRVFRDLSCQAFLDLIYALEHPRAKPRFLQCPAPGCMARAEIRDGELPISRGLSVGIVPNAACEPPWRPHAPEPWKKAPGAPDDAHIRESVVFRCARHGWAVVYHERRAGERVFGREKGAPPMVIPRDGFYPCSICRVVVRLRLEATPRQHRAGGEVQPPSSLRDGYTPVT